MDRNLFAFLRVYEEGNLSNAADKIGLAQPSLTKRLKILEEEHQVALFERVPHGMVPTEYGRTLYDYASQIEQKHLQASEALAARRSGHLDVVRIGAGPIVRSFMMRELSERLGAEFHSTRLEFREDVHARNLPFLKAGELDVVFGAVSDGHDLEGIETIEIRVLTLGMLAHEDHSLFKRKTVTARDLMDTPWVDHSDESVAGKMIDGFYARHGLKTPQAAIRTTSLEFGVDLVASGRHIMPAAVELAAAFRDAKIKALPLETPIDSFPIGVYLRQSSLDFPVVQRLIEIAQHRQKAPRKSLECHFAPYRKRPPVA